MTATIFLGNLAHFSIDALIVFGLGFGLLWLLATHAARRE